MSGPGSPDVAKRVTVGIAVITLLITLYKGAIWVGDIEAKVVENTQELVRRAPYIDELMQLKERVAEMKAELERRREPTYRIEGIERDIARLEGSYRIESVEREIAELKERVDSLHYPGHDFKRPIVVPPEDRVVPNARGGEPSKGAVNVNWTLWPPNFLR